MRQKRLFPRNKRLHALQTGKQKAIEHIKVGRFHRGRIERKIIFQFISEETDFSIIYLDKY